MTPDSLAVNDAYHNDAEIQSEFRPEGKARTVSFLGKTGVGKSTLIGNMLRCIALAASAVIPTVGNAGMRSTSAGVRLFPLRYPGDDGSRDLLLLDFEGMGAGLLAPTEAEAEAWASKGPEEIEKRNKIVEAQLPRLAFVVSNVIIFVTESNWRDGSGWQECLDFAKRGCKGVRDTDQDEPPLLLIVSTSPKAKAQEKEAGGQDKLTAAFLENHDPKIEREILFREVRCVSLTHYDQADPASVLAYQTEVKELTTALSTTWARPFPFPETVWLRLVKSVALKCATKQTEPVSMQRSLRAARDGNPLIRCAVDFFRQARAIDEHVEWLQELFRCKFFEFEPEVLDQPEAYLNELMLRLGIFTDQAAARATIRVYCLLVDQFERPSPGLGRAVIDPKDIDLLLTQLDGEMSCPSHSNTERATIEPKGTQIKTDRSFVGQCTLAAGHRCPHRCPLPRKFLKKTLRDRLFFFGSSNVTMTWDFEVAAWLPSEAFNAQVKSIKDEAPMLLRDQLCCNWQPIGDPPAVGTPVSGLAERILVEEFGSNDYRQSIGTALVDGIGRWVSDAARTTFANKGAATVEKVQRKLHLLFRGKFATTNREFVQATPKPADDIPEQLCCRITFEVSFPHFESRGPIFEGRNDHRTR